MDQAVIKLVPVNVKRFELIRDEYVDAMTARMLPVTRKPGNIIKDNFFQVFDRVTGRKWELRYHHFREIHLLPENEKIGFLWYRTHKEGLFSDVAVLQWMNTDKKEMLKEYIESVIDILIIELKETGIKRLTTEVFNSDVELAEIFAEQGFEPVRTVMHKRLE